MYSGPLNIAIRAAREAGKFLLQASERVQYIKVTEKSRNNFVTEIDRCAEKIIINILKDAYPDYHILAEESAPTDRLSDLCDAKACLWIIDPLDGTTNYIHRFPNFCVSISLKRNGHLESGVTYDPIRDELFTAQRGLGSFLNQQRIRVSKHRTLSGALLGTGFPFKERHLLSAYLNSFSALFQQAAGIRRVGSAALDLAYIACGRLDGFWELGLAPWDIAAGALLIEEAGGFIMDIHGGDRYLQTGGVIAGNVDILKRIQQAITPHMGDILES